MTTARQTLLHRARVATLGLVLAAGSATGLLTVAAAQATPAPTPTRSSPSYVGDDDGGWRWSDDDGWQPPSSTDNGGGPVAGSHAS